MTALLNDDGTASMATLFLSAHHAFRRDIACLAAALAAPEPRGDLISGEWTYFRNSLHGHHQMEDTAIFPSTRAEHPEIADAIVTLEAQHHQIDPLLARGDEAFRSLATGGAGDGHAGARDRARATVAAIADLLATHLELEERTLTPHLRGSTAFPPPPNDDALAMYAEGFAWSTAGLAPNVQQQIFALLPAVLRERIPAARAAFDERCRRVWGRAHQDTSTTSIPAT